MKRRDFLAASLAGAAGAAASGLAADTAGGTSVNPFQLKYAPHLGMFRHRAGNDPVDQVKFMADQGFTAFEDNGMKGRDPGEQARIAAELERQNMTMGVFVATMDFQNPTFVRRDDEVWARILKDLRDSVEVARRVNATWVTVVPGCFDPGLQWDYQTANAVELLKRCAEICEPSGLVMVLEPLNPWRDHPGLFLSKIPQAYLICRAVDSPSCKILFDIYHQQITEGNLIPNIDRAWDEIAYFQTGDNPGRKEPTTGEINYRNVFRHLHQKGYDGVIGMEHGNSKGGAEGETAVIEAYRACDDF